MRILPPMITIIPAIDLKGGKCVRLRQGLANEETVYSDSPVEMAKHWVRAGGEFLHVVDLDGAFEGRPVHTEVLREICAAIKIPVAQTHVRKGFPFPAAALHVASVNRIIGVLFQ